MRMRQEKRPAAPGAALLTLWIIFAVGSCSGETHFEAELIRVDTSAVTRIVIYPEGGKPAITLKREERSWIAGRGNVTVRAVPEPIHLLLRSLSLIKTEYLAAKDAEAWATYGVTEEEGTRVRAYQEEALLEEFYIGHFSASGKDSVAVSYLRLAGEKEVYAVNGFQTLAFTQAFNRYRNPLLFRLDPGHSIYQLDYRTPDTLYSFTPSNEQWLANRLFAVDSSTINTYLQNLRQVEGAFFADRFDELQAGQLPNHAILLYTSSQNTPLSIDLYRDSTRRERPFILRSSQRPDTFFASDSSGLYKTVFATPEAWIRAFEQQKRDRM